jgi:hypothetical protein
MVGLFSPQISYGLKDISACYALLGNWYPMRFSGATLAGKSAGSGLARNLLLREWIMSPASRAWRCGLHGFPQLALWATNISARFAGFARGCSEVPTARAVGFEYIRPLRGLRPTRPDSIVAPWIATTVSQPALQTTLPPKVAV